VKHDHQQLAQILLDRRTKRRSLTAWARHCGYEPARHHKLIISRLEAVARGEIRRLMIIAPPGSSKSTFASILFPCFLLANKPDAAILCASHTVELAEKWGRRVRGLIADHGLTLGIELSPESKAAGRWSLTTPGEFLAAGVGTGIAGFRAHGVIVDDPTRSFEDSASPTIRDRNWSWFKADLRTRLRPNGFIVIIGTRWHHDDIFGRAIDEMNRGGEQWEILHLEAQCESNNDPLGRDIGQFLWDDDEKYPYAELLQREKLIQPPRNWSALFQGRPTPDTGDFFEENWLVNYDEYPRIAEMRIYGSSDFAVTSDGGDYTCHMIVGLDPQGRLYLLDLWRRQTAADEWVEKLCDLIRRWKPQCWGLESGQIKSAIGPYLRKRMIERSAYCRLKEFPSRYDKAIRARSIQGRMATSGLFVPTKAPWYSSFREELLQFPAGKYDDQVDALSLIGQMLDRLAPGQAADPEPEFLDMTRPVYLHPNGRFTNSLTLEDLWQVEGR